MALGPKIKPCSAKKGIRYFVAVGCQSTTYGLALVASHPRIVSAKATAANSAGKQPCFTKHQPAIISNHATQP
jgi:hypothetical protein